MISDAPQYVIIFFLNVIMIIGNCVFIENLYLIFKTCIGFIQKSKEILSNSSQTAYKTKKKH